VFAHPFPDRPHGTGWL